MKYVRFYLEYDSPQAKRKDQHSGNCLALLYENVCPDYSREAIVAVHDWPNSGVCGSSVSLDYLRERCKRVPERTAREIHPALFAYLDRMEDAAP